MVLSTYVSLRGIVCHEVGSTDGYLHCRLMTVAATVSHVAEEQRQAEEEEE